MFWKVQKTGVCIWKTAAAQFLQQKVQIQLQQNKAALEDLRLKSQVELSLLLLTSSK